MSKTAFANSTESTRKSQAERVDGPQNYAATYRLAERDPYFAEESRDLRWGGSGRVTPLPEYDRDLITLAQLNMALADTVFSYEACGFDPSKHNAANMLTDNYALTHLARAKAHPDRYGLKSGQVGPVFTKTVLTTLHLFRKWSAATGRVTLCTSNRILRRQIALTYYELHGSALYRTAPDRTTNPDELRDAPDLLPAAELPIGPCPKATLKQVRRFLRHIGLSLERLRHYDGSDRGLIIILPALPANAKRRLDAAPGTFYHSLVPHDRPDLNAFHVAFETPQVLRTRLKKLRNAENVKAPAAPPESLKQLLKDEPPLFDRFLEKWRVRRDSGEIVSPLIKWFHRAGDPLPRIDLPENPLSASTLREVAFAQATMHMASLTPAERAQLELEGLRLPAPPRPVPRNYDPTRHFNLKTQGPSLERAAVALATLTSTEYAFKFIYEELVKTFNCCDIHHNFVPHSLSFLTRVLNRECERLLASLAAPTQRMGLQQLRPLSASERRRALAQLAAGEILAESGIYPLSVAGSDGATLIAVGDFAAWRRLNESPAAMNELQLTAERIGASAVYFAGPRNISPHRMTSQVAAGRRRGELLDLKEVRKIKRAATRADKNATT